MADEHREQELLLLALQPELAIHHIVEHAAERARAEAQGRRGEHHVLLDVACFGDEHPVPAFTVLPLVTREAAC